MHLLFKCDSDPCVSANDRENQLQEQKGGDSNFAEENKKRYEHYYASCTV